MSADNTNIRVANWTDDRLALADIRRAVFIDEQDVPEELEWDEYDASSTHFLVTVDSRPVATARLKTDGQVGRMAVMKEHRHQGIGRKLLHFLIQHAARDHFKMLYLHAQVDALTFYEKQGFAAHGDVFYEADIAHRAMTKKIG